VLYPLEAAQEVGFTPTHLDAVGSLSDPPILAATVVSALLLMAATIIGLVLWFRPARHRLAMRASLVVLGPLLYLVAAIFQMWIGSVFYRYYCQLDSSMSLGLYVPVAPVLWSGATAGLAFLAIRGLRRVRRA